MEAVKDVLGKWGKKAAEATKKAEDLAGNMWQHCMLFPPSFFFFLYLIVYVFAWLNSYASQILETVTLLRDINDGNVLWPASACNGIVNFDYL